MRWPSCCRCLRSDPGSAAPDRRAGFSYLPKRELTEDQVNATVQAPGRKGDELPRIPRWTGDFAVQYERGLDALPQWTAWVRGDCSVGSGRGAVPQQRL